MTLLLIVAAALAGARSAPSEDTQQRALQAATAFAQGYTERLPDFTCIRTTKHFLAPSRTKQWREQATTAYELSYYARDEHYKLIWVDGAAVKRIPKRSTAGGWIEMDGNFGGILKQLFEPRVHPHFAWQREDSVQGRRAMVFRYRIALAESRALQSTCSTVLLLRNCREKNYAFHGEIFLDAESFDILRISATPDDLPASFAIGETSVDYARILVAGKEYLLPSADRIETWNGKTLYRNDSTYTEYRKFVAESTLIP